MARKKENKPMTRQVRIYEDDAKVIELVLATRGRGATFADVIREAIENRYPSAKNEVESILQRIEDATASKPSNRTKRNAG